MSRRPQGIRAPVGEVCGVLALPADTGQAGTGRAGYVRALRDANSSARLSW
jgi:hypothetical protein